MADNSQTRTARRKQKKKKNRKKPLWKRILLFGFIIILAIGIGIGGLFTYWIVTAPDIDAEQLSDPFSSSFLDQNGDEFAVLGAENRIKVDYEDLPQVLIDAVTATEDARFFEHAGIDLRRIGGAILANFKNGFGSEGASTITQQVVEKSFLTPEKELKLKVQEQWLALKLERQYSKEEILEMYLNKIFYGANSYGVAKAAETYFGVTDLQELTLPQAAILAGLPQRPTAYNPFQNPDLTKERMDTVLTLMVRHGKVTQAQADEARAVDIPSLLVETQPDSTPYEAFIQQVEKEVKEKVDGADIFSDGLKIHTTLDPSIQDHVEFLLTDSDQNPIPYPDDEMQAGMVILDTKNGAIKAIGGSRNNDGNWGTNYATEADFQPGSTIKPILDYGPAIEYDKMSTYHLINDDKPYEIAGTDGQVINNWNRQYSGWITARHALSQSLNVPAVKVFEEVGRENAKTFAEGLGINFADDQVQLTDAIGGAKTEITPLQLAGAYRAFGNEGIYNEPYAVTKVEFPDGRVVDLVPEPEAVMSDYTAYMITDMLKTSITEGVGYKANVPGLPIAGKTGTTNLKDKPGSPDSWLAGYTTNYTMAVWTGGYTDEEGKRDVMPTTEIPHALFKNTMETISQGLDTADFAKPDSVVEVAVEKGSNPATLPSEYTPSSQIVTELFVKGTEPTNRSKKYDELDPVTGLKATYDEEANAIRVDWQYDSENDVTFDVSATVNGGEKQNLSSTEEKSIEISEVEPNAEYVIEVIVNDGSSTSKPATTSVKTPGDEEEEELPGVSGLSADYIEESSIIDVSWDYNGPPAAYEVSVNGQVQTVDSKGIEISGGSPGQNYTITVTPIGKNGANEGIRGVTESTSLTIPNTEEDNTEPEPDSGNEPESEPESEPEPEPDPEPEPEPEPDPEPNPEQDQDTETDSNPENQQDSETDTENNTE
ncbi:penicillin-binding protein [Oceanobacillus zhaokaii]|uniref:Penicillin-binding protein n=1 Tax=Oceanobacillus zhaokaii TaxID=2052660 RepID=A0A345PH44_9BACI|nr:PBP1A family penicillin-binding protein [Oceanobacillus zhaokaii]AXI09324.1 penicillin-binding protein [Oceanobacillus zhaokaii]